MTWRTVNIISGDPAQETSIATANEMAAYRARLMSVV